MVFFFTLVSKAAVSAFKSRVPSQIHIIHARTSIRNHTMCRHTYHHYPNCGHIANYTVMSCLEFTYQLRHLAGVDWHLSCDSLRISHDLLPADHSDLCLQCAYDWNSVYVPQDHEIQFPEKNLSLEEANASHPIIDVRARMVGSKRSPDTNLIHETRTDLYQSNPLRRDPECTCSACLKLMSVRPDVRQDLDFLTCGSPMSLDSLFIDTFDSSCVPEFDMSHDLGFDLHDGIDPFSQLDLDHERHGAYTSAGERIDVCEIDNLILTLYDFDHLSHSSSIDSFHVDEKNNFESMPDIVTDCLARLDLDCVEDHMNNSTEIDLLAALPSPEEVILELIQAFRTGIASNDISPEILSIANKRKANLKPPGISTIPTLNHSDSRTSLWNANMSSASSPNFRNNADRQFSDLEPSSFGTTDNLDTSVKRGTTADFLDFSDDEEEGGCSLAGDISPLSWMHLFR